MRPEYFHEFYLITIFIKLWNEQVCVLTIINLAVPSEFEMDFDPGFYFDSYFWIAILVVIRHFN
jgi:hypothetical protein